MNRSGALLAAALLALTECASAIDIGFPAFRSAPDSPAHQIEFIYDDLKRTVRTHRDRLRVGSPATGPVETGPLPPVTSRDFGGDSVIFRYTYSPTERLALQFDLGLDGETNLGDRAVILGGAVRFLLREIDLFTLSFVADGRVMPKVDATFSGRDPVMGDFTGRGEGGFTEFGATLLGSMKLVERETWSAILYGGPRLSSLRVESDSYADFENQFVVNGAPVGSRAWGGAVEKQRSPFGVVLGLRTDFGENWTARVETRLIEESSFSCGLGTRY